MKLTTLVLALTLATAAHAVEMPSAPLPQHFSKKVFTVEVASYTAANVFDGVMTIRNARIGAPELPFPQGSAELVGKFPTVTRYAAVYGAIEIGESLAAWKLEHSNRRGLRLIGHGLMVQGSYIHFEGGFHDIRAHGIWQRYNAGQ